MNNINKDNDFKNLVFDILDDKDFNKLKNNKHHGLTRYEHSLKVSYYSYRIAKKLKLDYESVARAGLLHDFFDNDDFDGKEKNLKAFYHPYKSLENASKRFYLSDLEKDIIIAHMFPLLPHKVPKYVESWIVSGVDKFVALYEFIYSYSRILSYRLSTIYILLLLIGRHTIL